MPIAPCQKLDFVVQAQHCSKPVYDVTGVLVEIVPICVLPAPRKLLLPP